ncbi:hypothetical protein BCR32DRAFT_291106 [Anaeromyces robustus]|uniref:Uncharacterized protein n=1 Tax=Anaeromyces robustus TaxID=1754192 RepID=A0A1Y1XG92_9FUNG|nr:hypothetical protein BCR32DRAFT_291106 [Anaeromyces robustus]|eukprot:ORX84733.1 hypothetical protein BCR32DRAFT_291106 [Anaeromyces robustus]
MFSYVAYSLMLFTHAYDIDKMILNNPYLKHDSRSITNIRIFKCDFGKIFDTSSTDQSFFMKDLSLSIFVGT